MAAMVKIYLSFALEDEASRRLLRDQAKEAHLPFEFVDLPSKQPWDGNWRAHCRSVIRECDGVIAIISMNTAQAPCVLWEIKCANQEKIPLIGIFAHDRNRPSLLPTELSGKRVISWDWAGIADFMRSLR